MKAVVIVDGLNLYHALKDLGPNCTNLDVARLARRLLPKDTQVIAIYYFTSAPEHVGGYALKAHRSHVELLNGTGVKVIEGRFQKTFTKCKVCGALNHGHIEKETDVSIALQIVESASNLDTREILIFSADSDLSPALRLAKATNLNVKLTIVQTAAYISKANSSLMAYADDKHELKSRLVHNYQFTLDK